jgi:hypothetical protein
MFRRGDVLPERDARYDCSDDETVISSATELKSRVVSHKNVSFLSMHTPKPSDSNVLSDKKSRFGTCGRCSLNRS